jgi:hypothetical protein
LDYSGDLFELKKSTTKTKLHFNKMTYEKH